MGNIYIIRNTINDKVYVGQTKLTVAQRFAIHVKPSYVKNRGNNPMYKDIAKYGKECFYAELLEDNVPDSEMDDREMYYIEKYDSIRKGYNIRAGGKGGKSLMPKERQLAKFLLFVGASERKIAELMKVHPVTIQRMCKEMGIVINEPLDEEKLTDLFHKGYTHEEIAEELNVNKATILRHCTKLGLNRRRESLNKRTDFDYDGLVKDYYNQMPINELWKSIT